MALFIKPKIVTPQVPAISGMTPLGLKPAANDALPLEAAKTHAPSCPDPDCHEAVEDHEEDASKAVCPHTLEEGETTCEICAPLNEIKPGWCEDEHCSVQPVLEQPHVKDVTLARSCDTEEEYVNIQHHHFGSPYKITKVLKGMPDGSVLITFWADHLNEWLTCTVPQHYRLTTAPNYKRLAARPQLASPEARRARAAHLAPYRRQREELEPAPAQPGFCIVGQIGADKVLVDAGDGTVLQRYPLAKGVIFNPKLEAQNLGRVLVGQKDATQYAMMTLRRAWADAKAAK